MSASITDIATHDLSQCCNLFGKLNAEIISRLEAVIKKPSLKTWDDTYSIILRSSDYLTLWQAVIAVDPSFPRTGKCTDQHGKVIKNWERVPDALLIRQALCYATEPNLVS